jgi:hypothetical protein
MKKQFLLGLGITALGIVSGCGGSSSNTVQFTPFVAPVSVPDVILAASNDNTVLGFVASTTAGLATAVTGSPFNNSATPEAVAYTPNHAFAYVLSFPQGAGGTPLTTITPYAISGSTVTQLTNAVLTISNNGQEGQCLTVDATGQFLFIGESAFVGTPGGIILRSAIQSDGSLSTPVSAIVANLPDPVTMRTALVGNTQMLFAGGFGAGSQLDSFTVDGSGDLTASSALTLNGAGCESVAEANTGTGGSGVLYVATNTLNSEPPLLAFSIASDATLTALGSPVTLATGEDCTSVATLSTGGQTFVYAATGSTSTPSRVVGISLNSDGSLTGNVVGSQTLSNFGNSILADPQGNPVLFASTFGSTNNLTAVGVSSTGSLTSLGTTSAGNGPNLTGDLNESDN